MSDDLLKRAHNVLGDIDQRVLPTAVAGAIQSLREDITAHFAQKPAKKVAKKRATKKKVSKKKAKKKR